MLMTGLIILGAIWALACGYVLYQLLSSQQQTVDVLTKMHAFDQAEETRKAERHDRYMTTDGRALLREVLNKHEKARLAAKKAAGMAAKK